MGFILCPNSQLGGIMNPDIKRISSIKSPAAFRERMRELGLDLPIEEAIETAPASPLAGSLDVGGFRVGNRWAIHPMEGWDATADGHPTPDLVRRWRRFGESGAKLLWGMEAVAVRPDGRANPHQLMANPDTFGELVAAAHECLETHARDFGTAADVLWGFQFTHSGRFCRPHDKQKLERQLA